MQKKILKQNCIFVNYHKVVVNFLDVTVKGISGLNDQPFCVLTKVNSRLPQSQLKPLTCNI